MSSRDEGPGRPRLTPLTRRKIGEVFERVKWWGETDEVVFLSRLYDLKKLPSTDPRHPDADGDIRRHRFANDDWPNDWVFSDDRFGLQQGQDEILLRFLAAALHPDVRDSAEARQLAVELNSHLSRDGYELYPVAAVSGYPTYGWRHRSPSTLTTPSGFPMDAEQFIASVAEVLRHRGRDRELAVLVNSDVGVAKTSYDNWDGGTTGWTVSCACAAGLYARLTDDERSETESTLAAVCREVLRRFPGHGIDEALIAPQSAGGATWRVQATRWLAGEGVTNQGRVRSNNIASLECDGLLFRSEAEIHLYRALKRLGVTFAPLPVFVRGGQQYARLEPDFVIVKDGHVI